MILSTIRGNIKVASAPYTKSVKIQFCSFFFAQPPQGGLFFMIFHVPHLLFNQSFTTLFILIKQSWLIIGSKKTAPKASFLRLWFNVLWHLNPLIFPPLWSSQSVMFSFCCVRFGIWFGYAGLH